MRIASVIRPKSLARSDLLEASATAPAKPSAQMQQVLTAMAENTGQVTTLLDTILKRLDEQLVLGNKRYEEQLAFNSESTKGMQNLQKQLDLTQKEVDEARKATSASPLPSASLLSDPRATGCSSAAPPVRLANDGAPLMPEPPAAQMLP